MIKFDFWVILTGRFFYGLGVGFWIACSGRFLEEMVPAHLFDVLAPLNSFFGGLGSVLAYMIAEILPADKDTAGLEKTDLWKVIYFYIPLFFFFSLLFWLTFIIKHDSPKFLLESGKIKET